MKKNITDQHCSETLYYCSTTLFIKTNLTLQQLY